MTAPIYSTGTVTVTNGSAILVGNGTAWALEQVAGGVMAVEAPGGNPLPILSVQGDAAATAAVEWTGPSGTFPYAISMATSRAAETVFVHGKLVEILARISLSGIIPDGAGTLAERNALNPSPAAGYLWLRIEPGADLEIYRKAAAAWDGPFPLRGQQGAPGLGTGGYGLPLGGTIGQVLSKSGAGNGAAAWGEIGNNGLPERLQESPTTFYEDFNAVPMRGGFYRVNQGALNGPPDITGFSNVLVVPFSATGTANPSGAQIAMTPTGPVGQHRAPVAYRTFNTASGGWGRWWRLDAPERIVNANGVALQFLDGSMICHSPVYVANVNQAAGTLWRSSNPVTWTFPAAFVGQTPTVLCQATAAARWGAAAGTGTTTSAILQAFSYTQSAADGVVLGVAFGRWF